MLHLAWLHLTCCVVGASEVGAVVGHFELCACLSIRFVQNSKMGAQTKRKKGEEEKRTNPFSVRFQGSNLARTKNKNKKNNLIAFTSNKQATVIADHAF